jgi:hypothetical protein
LTVSAFKSIERIPDVNRGSGAVICMAKNRLPLTPTDTILPVRMV